METDGPYFEDVQMLRKTVNEEARLGKSAKSSAACLVRLAYKTQKI